MPASFPSRTVRAGATPISAAAWVTCAFYRNHSLETGRRPSRYGTGTGIEVTGARTLEIAGNVIERSYAQGIDVHGAKSSGVWGDVPFARYLIHHNKVWESMLNCNDYGGIETWQGGPFYVFNNISYNALGYRNWDRYTGTDAGFGHAYYLDGAFKNYHFNNIAWGKAKDRRQSRGQLLRVPGDSQLPEHLFPEHRLQLLRRLPGARPRSPDATNTSATSGMASANTSSATPTRPRPPPKAMPRMPARRSPASRSNPTPTDETSFTTSRKWACSNPPGAGS